MSLQKDRMKSYLINLPSRPDRLESATAELRRVGLEPERFNAYSEAQAHGNRPLAFNKSQYFCIFEAFNKGHEKFAIFEDDVVFTPNAAETIQAAIAEIPGHAGIIHMGCNIIGMSTTIWDMPDGHSQHLAQLYNCWQSHAIIWTKAAAAFFLDNFPFYKDEYAKEGLMIFDEWLRQNMYTEFDCFVLNPMVAYPSQNFF